MQVDPTWLQKVYETVDAKDAAGFVRYFTDDGSFYYGNTPPVTGHETIRDFVAGFFGHIDALSHSVSDSWFQERHVISRGEVTYTRKDGSQVTVPFANVFDMDGDKITRYQSYVDITPLVNPPA